MILFFLLIVISSEWFKKRNLIFNLVGTSFTFTILSLYCKSTSCFQFVFFKKFPSRYWSQETTGDGLGHLFIRESRPLQRIHPIFFLGIQLIYNVVLISAVQQHDSVIHIIIFHIFSIVVYHRILNIYPCAIQ